MTRKIPKVETRHQVAVKLAAEFNVKKESAMQWFQFEFFKGLEGAEVVIPEPGRKYSLE